MSVFDALVGQSEVVDVLRRAAAGDGMTHAWLFTGPPGSGRSVAARAFAAALECPDGGCGDCASCRAVAAESARSLTVVRPAGMEILVDEARDIVRRAALAPTGDRWQITLIEDADRLNEKAENALLKAIEEPVRRSVFLLCAPSAEDLLPTTRSRCRVVTLRLPTAEEVAEVLVREGVDPALAHFAARAAQGHVGRARALATDETVRRERRLVLELPTRLGTVGECFAAAADLVSAAGEEAERRTKAATAEAGELLATVGTGRGSAGVRRETEKRLRSQGKRSRRDSLDRALVDLAAWYRDVLTVQLGAGTELVHADQNPTIEAVARASTAAATLRRIEAVLSCREALGTNVDELLTMESLTLALRAG